MMAGGLRLSRAEVKDTIARFLDGTGEPWVWDDFVSVEIEDPFLDTIRQLCFNIREAYPPPTGSKSYCNERGISLMRALSDAL